jgi:diguanylate cyclase (GGDEF)-like protein
MRLAKKFSLATVPVLLIVGVLLITVYREYVQTDLLVIAEQKNAAVTRAVANALWPSYRPILRQESSALAEHEELQSAAQAYLNDSDNVKLRIMNHEGRCVFSTTEAEIGEQCLTEADAQTAGQGEVVTQLSHFEKFEAFDRILRNRYLVATLMPVFRPGTAAVAGVFELTSDVTPLVSRLSNQPTQLAYLVLASLGALFGVQLVFVASADRVLHREAERRMEIEKRLQFDALHDVLTGLPNRSLFRDRLQHLIDAYKRNPKRCFAVLFLDLDRFKVINDSLGHFSGDQLLIEAASRIHSNVRPGDTVARLGGDEFAVLLEEMENVHDATQVADRILGAFSETFHLGDREIVTTTSIGVFFCDDQELQVQDVLRNADIAMYHAKQSGKGQYALFGVEMREEAIQRVELEADLRVALKHDELRVCYQPIIDLQSGEVVSFEALLRWDHPERGAIRPKTFLTVAEDAGLIGDIDQWVLARACSELASWREASPGLEDLTMTVNLSGLNFADRRWGLKVLEILESAGVSGKDLKLELTESAVLNNTVVVENMFNSLRAAGVALCMDDFGTGFSSLSYIRRHQFDMLKIDRSFVSEMVEIVESLQIVRTIIDMGKILGVGVTAEGIETADQYKTLQELGCPLGQGYYFCEPLDVDEVLPFLLKVAAA